MVNALCTSFSCACKITLPEFIKHKFIYFNAETDPLTITSTAPVMVIQYGLSFQYDNVYGDAFMTTVPALTNYANSYLFPSPSKIDNASYTNTLAITIKRSDNAGLRLNGLPLQVHCIS